ncbi:YadA-like family protein [uncultured Psychrobacter sp.]|uniref:YadA family autotransporter adhesin n=1 Tax=uncultured Psychrobacter sp. TaxID=259303 RepID=UPI0026122E0D|nr:YadA-like family protein [uncultured Psychrobacter sp.]
MNRNYKVIWNEALQCFIAVAENAKAKGKSSKSSISASVVNTDIGTKSGHSLRLSALRSGLIAVSLTSLAIGMSSQAIAAVGVNGGTGSGTAVSECTNDSQANSGTNKENIAIGCASFTNDVGYQIADRDNPYYTNNTTSANTVEEGDRQAYTPERMNSGSMAIGTGARTEGALGLAVGQYARTTDVAGVAIGVGTLASGNTAIAVGRQSVASGNYSQAMGNVAAATGQGSLAVGHSATATGNRSIAIGASDIDEAEDVAGQKGAAYQTLEQTRASGQDSIALGSGAQATTDGSVAIGNGSNTTTDANSVTSATVGGVTFDNFAGATNVIAGDQISVGASGQERQIKNVAAGNVTATSTDAINGSQLFSVADTLNTDITDNRNNISGNTTNITNNTNRINDGINFGNGVTATNFALGDTINVTGDDNITSTTTANGVQVQLNRDLALNSVTTGNTLINNGGVTLTGGSNQTVRLSNNGLDNGGNKITNVARGTEGSDAVNFDQLNEVRDSANSANQGFNVSAQGENTSTVRPGDNVDLNNQDGNIVVSKDANSNNVSFDLNKDVNLDSATFGDVVISSNGLNNGGNKITNVGNGTVAAGSSDAITGDQLNNTADSITTVIGGNAVNNGGVITTTDIGGTGQDTIDGAIGSIQQGVTNTNTQVNTNTTNIANNTTNITNNTNRLDGGLNFGADSGNNINKPIGDDSVLGFVGGNNVTTTAQGSSIRFDLNNNINVDSVTTDRVVAGNTTVNNEGVTLTGGDNQEVKLSNNGLDNGGNRITNVADGVEDSDAVNVGQLNDQFDSIDRVINGEIADMDSKLEGKVDSLGYRIDDVEDDANAGISAAMAMSSLPQAYIPGKSMVGGGVASYNGESAVAIGVSRVSDNGRWVMKINGTADTQGNAGGAIGAGFHF